MAKQPGRITSGIRSLLPNAGWDAVKHLSKLAYDNFALFIVIMGAIGTALTALANRLRGIPSDLIGVLVVFGVAVLVALISYILGKLRNKRDAEPQTQTPSVEERIGEIISAETPPASAQPNPAQCEYELVHRIADHQAKNIRDFVSVSRVAVWEDKLKDPVPTIRWGLMIRNNSIFPISLVEVRNNVFFEKTELAERRFESLNEVEQLGYWREGSVVFEQRLSGPEAQHIKNTPDGKFRFNRLIVKVGNPNNFPVIEPQELVIGDDLETTLNKITYKETEGMESLRKERNHLQSRLEKRVSNAGSASGDDKLTERKALIESWRVAVSTAVQQYRKGEFGNYTFTVALEHQEAYMTLIPKLSVSSKTALEKDADVSRLMEILANEIARIEQEWGLHG